jgi:hypothetical protein
MRFDVVLPITNLILANARLKKSDRVEIVEVWRELCRENVVNSGTELSTATRIANNRWDGELTQLVCIDEEIRESGDFTSARVGECEQ